MITGYRNLSSEEISIIDEIKVVGNTVEDLIIKLQAYNPDHRWIAIGKTHLQEGFMALVRSIAKPNSF